MFVYVDHFDKNGDIIATRRYIVVVYDDYDKECTGRVTDLYANDMSVKCYDEYYFDCWADTDGEVCYYILSDNLTWNSVSVDGSWFYAQDKGTDIIQLYAVDTNCNVVETTCNVTARFTFFQMISNFFNSIFSWFYRF